MIPGVVKKGLKRLVPRRPPLPERQWLRTEALFTISTGRTATTTLAKMLNASPEMLAFHEPEPRLLEELRGLRIQPWEVTEERKTLFKDARSHLISRANRSRRVYAEGALLKWLAPTIAELMPKAKFLFLHRHPYEFIRSGLKRGWYLHHVNDRYRILPADHEPASTQWAGWNLVQKITWFWTLENRYFIEVMERMGPSKVLEIPFHQFVDFSTASYIEVFDFLSVRPPPPTRISRILGTRHNVQTEGQAPTPQEWGDETLHFIEQHAGPTMARLGYILRPSDW